MKAPRKPVGLARFGGVNRWSPPGRLARVREPKLKTSRYPPCAYCFSNHAVTTTCLDAASTPDQRGWHR